MTIYALTDLQTGEVEVRYERFDQGPPEARNGKTWLIDNGPGAFDTDQFYLEIDTPIADGATLLPYKLVAHGPEFQLEKKRRQITALESTITPRRLREAVLTQAGADWLVAKEAEIQAIRDQM